jgi:signal transduction histidine kinase
MGESYSRGITPAASGGGAAATTRAELALARELLARLVPAADVELLLAGLLAERSAPPRDPALPAPQDSELDPPARELRRVRTHLLLGEAARMIQHAINNPLTALLAEAQMLELELAPLSDENRMAVARLVDLARRVVAATRRLDTPTPTPIPTPAPTPGPPRPD